MGYRNLKITRDEELVRIEGQDEKVRMRRSGLNGQDEKVRMRRSGLKGQDEKVRMRRSG